ncbi:hypothetical protein OSTOST_22485, partial [Ostertagia ostertagi]
DRFIKKDKPLIREGYKSIALPHSTSYTHPFTRCMVDIGTLRKPLRQWELEEVTAFLEGIITDYEKEVFVHNNLNGSRLKDFCCMDFLVHILRISESSAAKVMSVLRPYLDEMEDTHSITRHEYRYLPRKRHRNSRRKNKKSRGKSAEDQSQDIVSGIESRESRARMKTELNRKNVKNERHSSGDDRTIDNPELKTMLEEESPLARSCSTQNDDTLIEHFSIENT